MREALLILNAGSSSLKVSVYRDSDPPELLLRGQLESLLTEPQFEARDAADAVIDEHSWPSGLALGHAGADFKTPISVSFVSEHQVHGQAAGGHVARRAPNRGLDFGRKFSRFHCPWPSRLPGNTPGRGGGRECIAQAGARRSRL